MSNWMTDAEVKDRVETAKLEGRLKSYFATSDAHQLNPMINPEVKFEIRHPVGGLVYTVVPEVNFWMEFTENSVVFNNANLFYLEGDMVYKQADRPDYRFPYDAITVVW